MHLEAPATSLIPSATVWGGGLMSGDSQCYFALRPGLTKLQPPSPHESSNLRTLKGSNGRRESI
eukprot:4187335-Amphidinium_carterae.1